MMPAQAGRSIRSHRSERTMVGAFANQAYTEETTMTTMIQTWRNGLSSQTVIKLLAIHLLGTFSIVAVAQTPTPTPSRPPSDQRGIGLQTGASPSPTPKDKRGVGLQSGPSPAATPTDKRGVGVQSGSSSNNSQAGQQPREAKPELVLQTGYNNFFGATRFVFSPDGRLLATTTFRSSTVKLWETATGRELRNLSSGTHSAMGMSPFVAFSRDGRLIAAAAGDNSVKIWDVVSGRELQTLAGTQGSMTSAIAGVSFIAFTPDGRVVTISDAIRVWDAASGQELRSISMETNLSTSALMGGGGGAAITPDGNQLAFVISDGLEKHRSQIFGPRDRSRSSRYESA